jgi:hypothetical protein
MSFTKYGLPWTDDTDLLEVEFYFIRKGGQFKDAKGRIYGNSLFYHYREAQKLLWPQEDHNRWSDLLLQEFINNTITCVLGPKDAGKTRGAAKFALTDWFCYPDETLVLISSTDLRGLELRVWGDLKYLWQSARASFPWLAGVVLESKHAITSDEITDGEVRDLRRSIVCIPTMSSGGTFVGLGKWVGIKQKRRRLVADECSLMKEAFLESIANLNSGDFKGVLLGNPLGQDDPLDKASEPKEGWSSMDEPDKTVVWDNRWLNGRTVNLVGTDSPNFDFPQDPKPRFSYLINKHSIANVEAFYGKDSLQYYSQCKGVRKSGLNARRVITREMCEENHAFDTAQWLEPQRTKIGAADIAYGGVGGDRCIVGWGEFGPGIDGQTILLIHEPMLVPVSLKKPERVEDQIATFIRDYCKDNGVPPINFGYDSTGRGAMGTRFASNWSAEVVSVEFGGSASNRPVTLDTFIKDEETGERRLQLCYEHYSKFVTELWFSVRYVIEGGQLRGLTPEVAREGYSREWKMVRGNKIEIETKDETKKRMGRSPDLFDWLVTLVEVARQRGLEIRRFAKSDKTEDGEAWYEKAAREQKDILQKSTLIHTY